MEEKLFSYIYTSDKEEWIANTHKSAMHCATSIHAHGQEWHRWDGLLRKKIEYKCQTHEAEIIKQSLGLILYTIN